MHGDLRMIPRESALFSGACKPTSQGIVPYHATAKVPAPQIPWCVSWFMAPQEISGGRQKVKSHLFLCIFMGCSSETSTKSDRNNTTEKSPRECAHTQGGPRWQGNSKTRALTHGPPRVSVRRQGSGSPPNSSGSRAGVSCICWWLVAPP